MSEVNEEEEYAAEEETAERAVSESTARATSTLISLGQGHEFSSEEEVKPTESTASLHPSYSRMRIPFHILCQRHMHRLKIEAKKELKQSHEYQVKSVQYALDGVRLHRMYIAGTCAPKFQDIFTTAERKRIEDIVTSR